MNLTKKQKKIKYLVYCLLILCAGIFQNVSGLLPTIGGAKCFLLLPVAVALGIDEDEKISALLGLFAGLLWDMISIQHFGFNAIFIMLICFVSSLLVSYLLRSTYWVTVVFAVISVVIYGIMYWLLFVVIDRSTGATDSLGYFYIPCMIYTGAMSLVVVMILRFIKKKINKDALMD